CYFLLFPVTVRMEEEEAVVSELKRQLEDVDLNLERKVRLLNHGLNKALNVAAVQMDGGALTRVKSQLYLSGVLSHCVLLLSPRSLRGNWSAATTLAQLTSSCCVGVEPGKHSQAFHRLFLPSVIDGLLSLASRLMRRAEYVSLFRKLMDSVGWLLRAHTQLTSQVLSSIHYEQMQMCEDVAVSLPCIQMWIQTCTSSRDFLSGLSDDSVLLLLNEAVGQLAVSSDSAVGGASIRLILIMANQQERRLRPLLLSFRGQRSHMLMCFNLLFVCTACWVKGHCVSAGLDSLLDKDWRGRGFDQEVDQLITLIQSNARTTILLQASTEHVQAACVIQAAWRSYRTRRRVKSLNRVVSTLQRRYRAWRRQQQQQREAQQWEEELKYQVRETVLPSESCAVVYLQECGSRRAAVVIQSFWRGFRERLTLQQHTTTHTETRTHTAEGGQDACRERGLTDGGDSAFFQVRRFLQRRRAAKAPPTSPFWIGQSGLTDSRREELKRQVEEHISLHPSSRVSRQECERLHEEAQLLLLSELQRGDQRRRHEERMEALLAHTHTQLELLRDAPPLSIVTATDAESFLSPSGPIAAQARDAHNAVLQVNRLPWWRTLGETAGGVDGFSPARLQELEAELGGLFVGGSSSSSSIQDFRWEYDNASLPVR
ncbi:hypothetical protein L3Q82_010023, partial [Scortum barcoo]